MSEESVVRETSAWRIVRQLIDHTWGGQEIDEADFARICAGFRSRGGLWESLMGGDMASMKALEDSLDELMKTRAAVAGSRLSFVALLLMK